MGVAASTRLIICEDVYPEELRSWPLEQTLALNTAFRSSGAGFLMPAVKVADLLEVPQETADCICKTLSRSKKKDSANIMTVLAVRTRFTFLRGSLFRM